MWFLGCFSTNLSKIGLKLILSRLEKVSVSLGSRVQTIDLCMERVSSFDGGEA